MLPSRFTLPENASVPTPAIPNGLVLCPIPVPPGGPGAAHPAMDIYRLAYEKAVADAAPSPIDVARRYSLN